MALSRNIPASWGVGKRISDFLFPIRTYRISLLIPNDQPALYVLALFGHGASLVHHLQHAWGDPHGVAVYAPEGYGSVLEKRVGGEVFL
jgi:hypothetical protein